MHFTSGFMLVQRGNFGEENVYLSAWEKEGVGVFSADPPLFIPAVDVCLLAAALCL